MRRSRWMRMGILVAALSIAATACGGGDDDSGGGTGGGPAQKTDDFVIGVSNTLAGNGWREQMICSVKAQALASGKVSKVIAISKNGGPTEQIQDLQNLISQGANAIIVNPSDREKLNPVIQQATQKNIVVVAVDQAVSEPTAYVATNDQVAYGRLGAEWLAEKLGGKGNVLYMRGIDGVPADSDRDEGFQEVMAKNPDIKVKEVFTGWDFTKGGDIAVQELTSGDYDGIWTSGIDYTVVNAFKTVGKDPVPVVGADNNQFIQQLLDGTPGAAVTNPAVIGGVGNAIALDVLQGKQVERFQVPAGVPDHLTVMDGPMRTVQHISPGVRCRSNALVGDVLDMIGEDVLFITSANSSSHRSHQAEAAHCEMREVRREFGHRRDVVLIGHEDEAANRAYYKNHLPCSTSILSFHRDVGENGRPALLLERHGSLDVDYIRAAAARHGFGVAIAPGAHERVPVRWPGGVQQIAA